MKIINSQASLIKSRDPFMLIETAGRNCYKSSSEQTEETAKAFFSRLVKSGHFAMLEHATFVFEVSESVYLDLVGHKYLNYSVEEFDYAPFTRYLVSGNLRAINESQEIDLLSALYLLNPLLVYTKDFNPATVRYFNEPHVKFADVDEISDIQDHAYQAHKYVTFHFICDRGVSHEIVRHRPASYAQESTRYCNYSKDKFDSELTFIIPNWIVMREGYYSFDTSYSFELDPFKHGSPESHWFWHCANSERDYLKLLELGWTPQQARSVLPNCLKTEVIMTANCREFNHFFDLRSRGTTGSPHPDMKELADKALPLYVSENRFINN